MWNYINSNISNISNIQTFQTSQKLQTFQTFKHSNIERFALFSNIQTFKIFKTHSNFWSRSNTTGKIENFSVMLEPNSKSHLSAPSFAIEYQHQPLFASEKSVEKPKTCTEPKSLQRLYRTACAFFHLW